jgi:hypothetical protein
MILVIWSEIPENIKLFLIPSTEENLRVAAQAHGHYLGTGMKEPAKELWGILSKETPIYDEAGFTLPAGITPTEQYSLVVVSGIFL